MNLHSVCRNSTANEMDFLRFHRIKFLSVSATQMMMIQNVTYVLLYQLLNDCFTVNLLPSSLLTSLYLLLLLSCVRVCIVCECIGTMLYAYTPAFVQLDEINHPIRGVCSAACAVFFLFSYSLHAKQSNTQQKHVNRICFFCLSVRIWCLICTHSSCESCEGNTKYKQHTPNMCVQRIFVMDTVVRMYACMHVFVALKRGNSVVHLFAFVPCSLVLFQ